MDEGDRSLATCQVEKFSARTANTAVSLEESPPASPSGPSISRMTLSQFFALDSELHWARKHPNETVFFWVDLNVLIIVLNLVAIFIAKKSIDEQGPQNLLFMVLII